MTTYIKFETWLSRKENKIIEDCVIEWGGVGENIYCMKEFAYESWEVT